MRAITNEAAASQVMKIHHLAIGKPKAPISSAERVRAQLHARNHVSIDQIAVDTRLSSSEVLHALEVLERQHGIGNYIDVSASNNVSVALRHAGGDADACPNRAGAA
jgi:hypothetical protein